MIDPFRRISQSSDLKCDIFTQRNIGPTRRQSQRRRLSCLVLTHESRQPPSWLIFDVRQRPKVISPGIVMAHIESQEVFPISKLGSECHRTNFGAVQRMPRNQGRDLMPWNQCGHPEDEIGASASDILGIPDSRFSKIGSAALPRMGKSASLHAVLVFEIPQPNKAPEPTPTSVMPRADARVTPAAVVAHL